MLTIVLSTLNAMAQHDWENTEALTKYPVFTLLDGTSDANVTTEIGTVQKHLGNPLWEQDRPWEPRIDNGYPNVIHDPADPLGSWRMWYGASLWEYATSEDGIHWTKPDLGMYDLGYFNRDWSHYGTHNNVIMFGNGMGIYKDIHEKDPNKRFKAFGGPSCFFGAGGGANNCTGPIQVTNGLCDNSFTYSPLTRTRTHPKTAHDLISPLPLLSPFVHCSQGTAVSPDGLYWYEAKNVTWPYAAGSQTGPHQKYDTHQNLFWDASKGKYIATTRDLKPFPWRSVAIAESNLEEFSFDTTYAPPSVLQGTANEQPYSQITFPYYGIYLGLTSVYDAQYGRTEGRVHLRLSWSRDAEHWNWVDQGALTGKDFIPLGRTGWKHNAFDSHIIFAAAYPKQMADDIRVYYMGGNGPHSGPR